MNLQETAFADLTALGWKDPNDTYVAIFSSQARLMSPAALEEAIRLMRNSPEVRKRIKDMRNRIIRMGAQAVGKIDAEKEEAAEKKMKGLSSADSDDVSKEGIIKGLIEDMNAAPAGKDRAAIREKIAALQGYKRTEAVGDENPTRIYAPARCEGCNLFQTALDEGKITKEYMDEV